MSSKAQKKRSNREYRKDVLNRIRKGEVPKDKLKHKLTGTFRPPKDAQG